MAATARRLPPMSPRVGLLAVAAVILGIVLYAGRGALGPFIVGLLLIYLVAPPIERLARFGLPRPVAILLVYLLVGFLIVEGLNLMLRPLVDQIRQFADELPGLVDQLRTQLEHLGAVYRGLELPTAVRDAVDQWLAKLTAGGIGFDPTVLLPVLGATTGFLTTVLAFLIIPVWAFYLLKDQPALMRAVDASIPPEWRQDIDAIIEIVDRRLRLVDPGPGPAGRRGRPGNVHRPARPQCVRQPDLRPVLGPAGGDRRPPRAPADHRPDPRRHPGRAHRRDRRRRGRDGRVPPLPRDPAARELLPRAEDPGRRHEPPPERRDARADRRRHDRGPARRDPRPARHGDGSRRLSLPVRQAERAGRGPPASGPRSTLGPGRGRCQPRNQPSEA